MLAQADVGNAKKVIEKEMVAAKMEAAELLQRADEERREILAEGKRQAALAREEAMTRGASAAFSRAAEEALAAFQKRADRYAEAADDIRTLAIEIAKKVLGTEPDLSAKDVERILQRGLTQLRAKRKVRVQVSTGRRADLAFERPNLMKAVDASPDLLVEDADDVREGFVRVVTEVGGALCAEESALDAVAVAVNIKETPRQRGGRSTGVTHVGAVTTDSSEMRDPRAATGKLPALRKTGVDDDRRVSRAVDRDDARADDRDDDDSLPSELPSAAVDVDEDLSLPDARFEEDDGDATRALPARVASPRAPLARDASGGGFAQRPSMASAASSASSQSSQSATAPVPATIGGNSTSSARLPTGRVEARGRAATRVVAVDEREQLVQQSRPPPAGAADDEDDLDLFTDDRPARRR